MSGLSLCEICMSKLIRISDFWLYITFSSFLMVIVIGCQKENGILNGSIQISAGIRNAVNAESLGLNANTVDFGNVVLNSSPLNREIILTNKTISNIALSKFQQQQQGATAALSATTSSFSVSKTTCPEKGTLKGGETCTFTVTYTPDRLGVQTAELAINFGLPTSDLPISLVLPVLGKTISKSEASSKGKTSGGGGISGSGSTSGGLDLLSLVGDSRVIASVGGSSSILVTVTNTGLAGQIASAISPSGLNGNWQLGVGGSCETISALAGGESCTVEVMYNPQIVDEKSLVALTVNYKSNGLSASPISKSIVGRGVVNQGEMALWFDAKDEDTVSYDVNGVSQWIDSSSHQNLTQAIVANRPTYDTLDHSLVFSGSSSLEGIVSPSFVGNQAHTIFIVYSMDSSYADTSDTLTNQTLTLFRIGSTSPNSSIFYASHWLWDRYLYSFGKDDIVGGSGRSPRGRNVVRLYSDGTIRHIAVNGMIDAQDTGFNLNLNSNGFELGHFREQGADFGFYGKIYEVIVYKTALSPTDYNAIEASLFTKWNLNPALPSIVPPSSLAMWVDSQDTANVIISGGKVTSWNDRSGNGVNLVQATALNQPVLGQNEFSAWTEDGARRVGNSPYGVRFDGDQSLTSSTPLGFSGANPAYTIYAVFDEDESQQTMRFGHLFRFGATAEASGQQVVFLPERRGVFTIQQGSNQGYGESPQLESNTGRKIVKISYDGTNRSIEYNGKSLLADTPASLSLSAYDFELGHWLSNNANYGFHGSVFEVMVFKANLSPTESSSIYDYLYRKWNINPNTCKTRFKNIALNKTTFQSPGTSVYSTGRGSTPYLVDGVVWLAKYGTPSGAFSIYHSPSANNQWARIDLGANNKVHQIEVVPSDHCCTDGHRDDAEPVLLFDESFGLNNTGNSNIGDAIWQAASPSVTGTTSATSSTWNNHFWYQPESNGRFIEVRSSTTSTDNYLHLAEVLVYGDGSTNYCN